VSAIYWWQSGGHEEFVRLLKPRFLVLTIDYHARTMTLRQWNRTYTVRCGDACREFAVDKCYSAVDHGSELEIEVDRRTVRCPIIKIEVKFDTQPGGLGSYIYTL
jgi:hypothetical protein